MGRALFVVFVVGLLIGLPIAIAWAGPGLVALAVEGKLSLLTVPQRFFNGINSFPLMAVPFFILAADLMTASGITMSLLRFTNTLVGHIRGGLGHVNVADLDALRRHQRLGAGRRRRSRRGRDAHDGEGAATTSTTPPRCPRRPPPSVRSSRPASSW